MYSIGIDIGTTSICAALMSPETGKIICTSMHLNDSFIETENSWEKIQDVSVITEKVLEVINGVLLNKPDDGEVISVGISNQMHGVLYIDADGEAVSPLYIWQDERGNLPYKGGKTYAQHLGSFAGYGLVTDFYNRVNSIVPETAVGVCTIGDYIAMKLTKTKKPLMHVTNAASFGCFDIIKNQFTIDNGMLPKVTAEFEAVGEWNGAKVCVAVGDNQASFIGSVNGDAPLLNVGTGSQISYLNPIPVTGENIESRPYDGKSYLVVGSSLCGGRAFSMLERFFASVVELATGEKCPSLYKQIDKLLEEKTETDMIADSRFCGTRFDPTIRGSITNISQDNFTAGDLSVAMVYAIANELHSMYTGSKTENIVCSGNGIRKNAALQKVASEIFSAKIKIPYYEEEAAYGAALTSLVAVGKVSDIKEAQNLIIYR